MTFDEFAAEIVKLAPNAMFADNDGELVVYTGYAPNEDNELEDINDLEG